MKLKLNVLNSSKAPHILWILLEYLAFHLTWTHFPVKKGSTPQAWAIWLWPTSQSWLHTKKRWCQPVLQLSLQSKTTKKAKFGEAKYCLYYHYQNRNMTQKWDIWHAVLSWNMHLWKWKYSLMRRKGNRKCLKSKGSCIQVH